MVAKISAKGCEIHTPFSPYTLGIINTIGINSITCLNKLRKIDFLTFPIDWKYTAPKIETPKVGRAMVYISNPLSAIFIRSLSFVNILINSLG